MLDLGPPRGTSPLRARASVPGTGGRMMAAWGMQLRHAAPKPADVFRAARLIHELVGEDVRGVQAGEATILKRVACGGRKGLRCVLATYAGVGYLLLFSTQDYEVIACVTVPPDVGDLPLSSADADLHVSAACLCSQQAGSSEKRRRSPARRRSSSTALPSAGRAPRTISRSSTGAA